jgi:signal transduction histidine kinase
MTSGTGGGWWTAQLRDVQEPLSGALDALASHAEAVGAAWRRSIEGFAFNPDEINALSALKPEEHRTALQSGNFEGYIQALQRQGQALAQRGVQEEHARTVLFSYLESSLPYLVGGGPGALAPALVRLASVGALALSAGYASARAASWRRYGERERERLSRDLHDEIGHHLVVLKLYLGMIARDLAGPAQRPIRKKLEEALDLTSQAIQSVRRLILDLGPGALDQLGFLPAVKLYARQFTARTEVKVRVRDEGLPPHLRSAHETALYRVLQGALSNVVKHAQARAVTITLGSEGDSAVRMVVEDDGVGFDTAVRHQAFGLAAMQERVAGLGGRFQVESWRARPGSRRRGTRIDIVLPLSDRGYQ